VVQLIVSDLIATSHDKLSPSLFQANKCLQSLNDCWLIVENGTVVLDQSSVLPYRAALLGLTACESGSLSKINPAIERAVRVPPFIVPECVAEQR